MPDGTPGAGPPDLDQLIARWTGDVTATLPQLGPHIEEIADHLRTVVEHEIAAGVDMTTAFAAAIREFGDPGELAREYAKSPSRLDSVRRRLTDEQHATRVDAGLAASWIGCSLAWAATVTLGDLSVNWMLVGWVATTFGPLTALDTIVRRGRRRAA